MRRRRRELHQPRWPRILLGVLAALLLLVLLPYLFYRPQKRAPGVRVATEAFPIEPGQARLLTDRTRFDPANNERVIQQEIFDEMTVMIRRAQQFIYLDFFLWNPWQAAVSEQHRKISTELADALIAKKRANPSMVILALTDPINRTYGDAIPPFFRRLAEAGIVVVFTDMDRLRDSNRLYAAPVRFYGAFLRHLWPFKGWLDSPRYLNPLHSGETMITPRQMIRLLFFKVNHRKVLICDDPTDGLRMVAGSMNPSDASSAHGNVGIALGGALVGEALRAELEVVAWSAARPGNVAETAPGVWKEALESLQKSTRAGRPAVRQGGQGGGATARWLTESAIRDCILQTLDQAGPDDEIRAALFYLSDRLVIRALKNALVRGADIRLILDPNKDAFGNEKNGIPNRPVAAELTAFAVRRPSVRFSMRWADTHGEQFHPKAMSLHNPASGRALLLCGSANWTRRNLDDINLEADLCIEGDASLVAGFNDYFDRLWDNADGLIATVPYEHYAQPAWLRFRRNRLYRFQEYTGLGTF